MTMVKFFTASLVSVLILESSAHAVCGNGVLDAGEACEDGNTTNGDGCDDTCAIESGWDCTEAVFELDFMKITPKMDTPSKLDSSSNGRTVTQSINSSQVSMCRRYPQLVLKQHLHLKSIQVAMMISLVGLLDMNREISTIQTQSGSCLTGNKPINRMAVLLMRMVGVEKVLR